MDAAVDSTYGQFVNYVNTNCQCKCHLTLSFVVKSAVPMRLRLVSQKFDAVAAV